LEAEKERLEKELRIQERKLAIVRIFVPESLSSRYLILHSSLCYILNTFLLNLQLRFKIDKAGKELSKLNSAWKPSEAEPDQELITEEERECFKNIGLKMESILVLGK